MLFLFVPQESWDLQLRVFGYITYGLPRIFGYVLKVIKYSISVPLDRGGFGGWNLMLTHSISVPLDQGGFGGWNLMLTQKLASTSKSRVSHMTKLSQSFFSSISPSNISKE